MAARGRVRIIGGRWRGRRLEVAQADDLRPTPDRVRETLFNWLAFEVDGARCLDLFAGTGALGLEALSRGAASVDFVERGRSAARALRESCQVLGAEDTARVLEQDALTFLRRMPARYDIIFIDPPFAAGLHDEVLGLLKPCLADRHRVYVETPAQYSPAWEESWDVLKSRRAGEVQYYLLTLKPDKEN